MGCKKQLIFRMFKINEHFHENFQVSSRIAADRNRQKPPCKSTGGRIDCVESAASGNIRAFKQSSANITQVASMLDSAVVETASNARPKVSCALLARFHQLPLRQMLHEPHTLLMHPHYHSEVPWSIALCHRSQALKTFVQENQARGP